MNDHLLNFHNNNWRRCNYTRFTKAETEVQEGTVPAAQLMVNYPQLVYHSLTHKRILQLSWTKKCLLCTHSLHWLFQNIFTEHLLWIRGPRGFNYNAIPVPWFQKTTTKNCLYRLLKRFSEKIYNLQVI